MAKASESVYFESELVAKDNETWTAIEASISWMGVETLLDPLASPLGPFRGRWRLQIVEGPVLVSTTKT